MNKTLQHFKPIWISLIEILCLFVLGGVIMHVIKSKSEESKEYLYFFSVSPNTRVRFSHGNLQFNVALGEHLCADGTIQPGSWRFAEHQWDFVGDAEKGTVYYNGEKCNNAKLSNKYDGWIDLFGWGTSGYNQKYPYMTKTNTNKYGDGARDIAGTYYDWGVYNQIGSDTIGIWRTLTNDEWAYLFHERENAQLLFGMGCVNEVNGVIILPDNWECPKNIEFTPSTEKGLTWGKNFHKYECEENEYYYNGNADNYSHNKYTIEEWDKLEKNGAIFLPTTGYRHYYNHVEIDYIGSHGCYYASTQKCKQDEYGIDNLVYNLTFYDKWLIPQEQNYSRSNGYSVRLVKEISE